MHRRKFARALGLALAMSSFAAPSFAAWPDRPIKLVVGYSVGTPPDILTRLLADHLRARLGQPIVVENRVGLGSMIAAEHVSRQPADGYTLMMATDALPGAPSLMKKPLFEPTDFVAVGQVSNILMAFHVSDKLQVNNMSEFIAKMKSAPGKFNYGSYGPTSAGNLSTTSFNQAVGIDTVHTPYRLGAQLIADLINGEVHYILNPVQFAMAHNRPGATKILAVTSSKRTPQLPDVPTVAETVPGYTFEPWWGLVVRKGTPENIVSRLNEELKVMLDDPKQFKAIQDLYMEPRYSTAQAFDELMKQTARTTAAQMKAAGVEPQ